MRMGPFAQKAPGERRRGFFGSVFGGEKWWFSHSTSHSFCGFLWVFVGFCIFSYDFLCCYSHLIVFFSDEKLCKSSRSTQHSEPHHQQATHKN